ncbi:MAG TPA: PucR family transcriptional regulator ligand-binding domain-containing protein, partial [Marmoricola sp.]|nr:PucR family transcriptional regulator ligand-binding domain-containing protein [Marmoricola sp.]
MLLRELVDAPQLHLRLLHAPAGALDRPVTRAMTTDLLHGARYLSGGELVITGLVWRHSTQDSEEFVASMAAAGAAALAVGDALLGSVPDDLVAACRRHDLALLEVPEEVAFAEITEHFAAAASQTSSASLARQRTLLAAIAAGRSLDELAARVSREIGHECRVLTTTGRHVVPGTGELAAEVRDVLSAAFLRADRLPTVVAHASASYSLFPVGSALGNRLASWIVVAEGDHRTWEARAGEAAVELAAMASLDRSRRDEGLRAVRHIADEALALLVSGSRPEETATRLRQAGLDPTRTVHALVADFPGRDALVEVARSLVEDVTLEFGPAVVRVADGEVVALVEAAEGREALLRAAFQRAAAGVGRDRLCVGISSPAPLETLAGAVEEARHARRVAAAGRDPVTVVAAEEVTSHVLLLATVPDDVRRTFATRVLGPVLEYDGRNDAGLLETLAAFLACDGSWSRTAEALHVHVNTVRYRIERVE